MDITDSGLRNQALQLQHRFFNVVDPVVQVVDLAAPVHFPGNAVPNRSVILLHHVGLNRKSARWRRLKDG